MIKISCYRTIQEKLPKAFCMLAEKCYHNKINVFVYANNKETLAELDKVLWTYSKKQFIPHGTIHDPHPEKQPILLGEEFKNLNNVSNLMIINADENQLLSILSTDENFNTKCERLFFVYAQDGDVSDGAIKNILTTSSLGEFKFESYMQGEDNSWRVIKE